MEKLQLRITGKSPPALGMLWWLRGWLMPKLVFRAPFCRLNLATCTHGSTPTRSTPREGVFIPVSWNMANQTSPLPYSTSFMFYPYQEKVCLLYMSGAIAKKDLGFDWCKLIKWRKHCLQWLWRVGQILAPQTHSDLKSKFLLNGSWI